MTCHDGRCLFCGGEQGVWHDMAACAYELAEQRAVWRQERFWANVAIACLLHCVYELTEQRVAWRQERFWLNVAVGIFWAHWWGAIFVRNGVTTTEAPSP